MSLGINLEIVNLQENAHLSAFVEGGIEFRTDFEVSEDKFPQADITRRNFLNLIRQDKGAGAELIILEARNLQTSVDHAQIAAIDVFQNNVEPIEAGTQRQSLLVNVVSLQILLHERVRRIGGDGVFERLDHAPADTGHASEQVQRGNLHAVLVLEAHVLVGNLNGDRNQIRIIGDSQEIGMAVKVDLVRGHARIHDRREILEFHRRRRLNLGIEIQAAKLVLAFKLPSERLCVMSAISVLEALGLGSHAHGFHLGQASPRDIEEGVLLAGIHGQVILTAAGGIHEFYFNVFADTWQIAVAPVFKRIS